MRLLALILILIGTNSFAQSSIPNPIIQFGEQDGKTNLKSGVRADIENYKKEGIGCKIVKFSLTVIINNGDTLNYENSGDSFTKLYKELAPILQGNEKLIFHDLMVQVGNEPKPRKLNTEFIFTYTKEDMEFRW
jgi:hypothetical protein